jgi:hypothetical protein
LAYTVQQLEHLVSEDRIPHDHYLIRVVDFELQDSDTLGRMRSFGQMPLWLSPLEQVEGADTAPEGITRLLGLQYDATKPFSLVLLKDLADVDPSPTQQYCPTWERMRQLAHQYLVTAEYQSADFDAVLNPAYAPIYRDYMTAFYAAGYHEYLPSEVEAFIAATPSLANDPEAAHLFRTRIRVHVEFGANQYFRGDGLTELLGDPDRHVGVQEVFLLEPEPHTVGYYRAHGNLLSVTCPPIQRSLSFAEPPCR